MSNSQPAVACGYGGLDIGYSDPWKPDGVCEITRPDC